MDTAHHNALREKWLANDPQLREAVEGMLGSTGKEYDAWQSRADALLRRHYEEDADEILNDPGVKAALAKEAQIREAAPAGKKPKAPKPLKGRSLQSRMTRETQNIRDYAQGRLPAPEAPDRMELPVAMPSANQSSVGRSTPSNWPLNRVSLEDMQARVAAERAARQPAPQAASASLEQAGISQGRPMSRDDLVRALTNARSGVAKPAEAKSSKGSKTFSPDTTLSKDDLGFLRTAAAKSDEAMDTLLQKRPELATQEGADEIMRVLDQALGAQRAGNGTKSLSNLIAGSARTLKYLQEVRNITPEVANDAGRVDAVGAGAPVQPAAAVRKRAADTENSGADSAVPLPTELLKRLEFAVRKIRESGTAGGPESAPLRLKILRAALELRGQDASPVAKGPSENQVLNQQPRSVRTQVKAQESLDLKRMQAQEAMLLEEALRRR